MTFSVEHPLYVSWKSKRVFIYKLTVAGALSCAKYTSAGSIRKRAGKSSKLHFLQRWLPSLMLKPLELRSLPNLFILWFTSLQHIFYEISFSYYEKLKKSKYSVFHILLIFYDVSLFANSMFVISAILPEHKLGKYCSL